MNTVNKDNLKTVDYRKLKPLQGELKDLKEKNYKKLLNSIKSEGFFVPVFVWEKDEELYLLDGHQRIRVLIHENIKFENTGYEIPYVSIEAENETEAKLKLLEITSQYGTTTADGYLEFTADLDTGELIDKINFDAINIEMEAQEEVDQTDRVECPECGSKVERDKLKGYTE